MINQKTHFTMMLSAALLAGTVMLSGCGTRSSTTTEQTTTTMPRPSESTTTTTTTQEIRR